MSLLMLMIALCSDVVVSFSSEFIKNHTNIFIIAPVSSNRSQKEKHHTSEIPNVCISDSHVLNAFCLSVARFCDVKMGPRQWAIQPRLFPFPTAKGFVACTRCTIFQHLLLLVHVWHIICRTVFFNCLLIHTVMCSIIWVLTTLIKLR